MWSGLKRPLSLGKNGRSFSRLSENKFHLTIFFLSQLLCLLMSCSYSCCAFDLADAIANVSKCEATFRSHIFAEISDDTLCIFGNISSNLNNRIIERINNYKVSTAVVYSQGGDVEYAINIGNLIRDHDMNLVVAIMCASSCANYIFTASNNVVVLPNSIVVWHGGPGEHSGLPRFRSDQFLEKVGVDKSLIYGSFLRGLPESNQNVGWTVSPEELRDRFGVKGIKYMWYSDSEIDKIFSKFNIRRLGNQYELIRPKIPELNRSVE
jgi:hypothetical protein